MQFSIFKMSLDEQLINLVRQYPIIYDISNQHYYDSVRKENAWEEIAASLNETVESVKLRWTSLRDCFRKALKKRKMTSGQKFKVIRPWKYENEMSFLKSYFGDRRKQSSNLRAPSEESEIENDTNGEEHIANSEQIWSTGIPSQVEVETATSTKSVKTPNHLSQSSKSAKSVKQSKRHEHFTVAHVLQTYLDNKSEKKRIISSPAPDHLRSFFQAMEDSVRTFSPLQQVEVKSQIGSLVSKIEVNNHINQQHQYSSCDHCKNGSSSKNVLHSPTALQYVQTSASTQSSMDPIGDYPSTVPNGSFPLPCDSLPIVQLDTTDQHLSSSATSPHNSQKKRHLSGNDFSQQHSFNKCLKIEFCEEIE